MSEDKSERLVLDRVEELEELPHATEPVEGRPGRRVRSTVPPVTRVEPRRHPRLGAAANVARAGAGLAVLAAAVMLFGPAWCAMVASPSRPAGTRPAGRPSAAPSLPGSPIEVAMIVDSEPERAAVQIDGQSAGQTPLVINHRCASGAALRVEVQRSGYRTWRWEGTCSDRNEPLTVQARLERR
jgi:hypothetical protein